MLFFSSFKPKKKKKILIPQTEAVTFSPTAATMCHRWLERKKKQKTNWVLLKCRAKQPPSELSFKPVLTLVKSRNQPNSTQTHAAFQGVQLFVTRQFVPFYFLEKFWPQSGSEWKSRRRKLYSNSSETTTPEVEEDEPRRKWRVLEFYD